MEGLTIVSTILSLTFMINQTDKSFDFIVRDFIRIKPNCLLPLCPSWRCSEAVLLLLLCRRRISTLSVGHNTFGGRVAWDRRIIGGVLVYS